MSLNLSFSQKTSSTKNGLLQTDGGARGNPGTAGCGWVLFDENRKTISLGKKFLGTQTNNVAEYQGLICGLEDALKNEIGTLKVQMDSTLIVEQMKGNWKVKHPGLKPLWEKAGFLAEQFRQVLFEYIPREKNKTADRLANQAMDEKK